MIDVANALIRDTYRKKSRLWLVATHTPEQLRASIVNAKRFMLDEAFSEFMAYLASAPFNVASERRPDVLDSMRHSSILPWRRMFVQFDGLAFRKGLLECSESLKDIWGHQLLTPEARAADGGFEVVKYVGWLFEQDDRYPDIVWMSEFMPISDGGTTDREMGGLPFRWAWSTSDRPFPPSLNICDVSGMFAHGITGYLTKKIGVQYEKPIDQIALERPHEVVDVVNEVFGLRTPIHRLVPEFGGVVRYALAFLSTLNNVPKYEAEARVQKSYLGGGRIRQYLAHTTLTLTLPQRHTKMIMAKRMIAMARRGWHEVRPHWRVHHAKLDGQYCAHRDAHIWDERDETGHARCKLCDATRVWIELPHGRGDPTISVRTHNYAVTHGER